MHILNRETETEQDISIIRNVTNKTQRLKACVSNVANSLMIKDSRVNSERTSHDVIHFFSILSKYSVIPLLSLDWLGK